MTKTKDIDIAKVTKVIMETMFQVKEGESVAITIDPETDPDITDGFYTATANAGGIPMIIKAPTGRADGQAGMADWPAKAMTAALCEVDIWIELNSTIILYSDIWETAMAQNKKLRYLILASTPVDSMLRIFTGYDISILDKLLYKVMEMSKACTQIRITSENGTDVTYKTDLNYSFDYDSGDFSKPKFGTAPGYVNVVPKLGSMNGRIVFDVLMHSESNTEKISFDMKDGKIIQVSGGQSAEKFSQYLSDFDDPNMYKISHNMIGLNPSIRELSGDIVEDERVWGGVDFGFGHTSPIDMPPNGQSAKSHFDGVVARATIYLDDQKIVDNGVVCHPDLKGLADELLAATLEV